MKALIIGATGATGKDLVKVLLLDPAYTAVILFNRRPIGMEHSKLSEIITDFDNLEAVSGHITGAVLFSCLGTTLKTAGSRAKQWHIDYEIPLKFAELASKNGIDSMVLLSAYGASPTSHLFYSRIKGQLEEKLASLAFNTYIIFKPGVLLRKNTNRAGERLTAGILKFLNSVGLIRKFRPMPTSTLAEKMARAPKILTAGKHIIELDKIFGF